MRALTSIIFIFAGYLTLVGQSIGQWTPHFSYAQDIDTIVQGTNNVYALTDGKLFSYDPTDESLEIYHKTNGADINHIAYSKKNNCLLIIRTNGDIDLLYSKENSVNIPGLKDMTQNLDKKVNNIYIKDDLAYISTNFGLLVIDVAKQEIKESVIFRHTFYASCVQDNKLYAATSDGTLTVDLTKNIQYTSNWEKLSLSSKYKHTDYTFSDKEIRAITIFDNKIVFLVPLRALYYLDNTDNVERILEGNKPTRSVNVNNRLMVSTTSQFWDFTDLSNKRTVSISKNNLQYIIPQENNSNEYWTAFTNENLSLIKVSSDNTFEYLKSELKPDGPISNYPFFMIHNNGKLIVTGGGAGPGGQDPNIYKNPARLSEFINSKWNNFSELNVPTLKKSLDFVSAANNPKDVNHTFVCAYGNVGLHEFKNNELVKIYNSSNSTLQAVSFNPTLFYLNGITYDKNNNLWVHNGYVSTPVKVLKANGEWSSIYYPEIDNNEKYATNAREFIVDKNNNKWISTIGGSPYIFLFNENGTIENTADDKTKYVSSFYDQDGKILSIGSFYRLTEDLNGNIWVGTNIGIFVIYNSTQIFNKNIVFNKIKIPRNDGTSNADILLENVVIKDIKVDGGNRKWIATPSGVYAVSSNGQEITHQFTMENSLLPSNNVISIAIDPVTGIVYIGTDKGLVSFRGEATEGAKDFSDVYAFPNPVRPDYEGVVTITGLKANSTVKITDVRGNLINQGTSIGGQYIWDRRNIRRERVDSGVYIVFGSSEDGKEGVVTKIMIVN